MAQPPTAQLISHNQWKCPHCSSIYTQRGLQTGSPVYCLQCEWGGNIQ